MINQISCFGQTVGAGARVVGVDVDPAMVAAAERRAADAGVSARVVHHASSASERPLPTAGFDVARADRLLRHTVNPELVVDEFARVTRRGGQIVLIDTDWESLSLASLYTAVGTVVAVGADTTTVFNACARRSARETHAAPATERPPGGNKRRFASPSATCLDAVGPACHTPSPYSSTL